MCTHLIFLPYSVPVFIQMKHLHLFSRLETSQLWFCSSDHHLKLYSQQTEEQTAAPNFSWKLHCIWMKNYILLLIWEEGKYLLCLNHHCVTNLSAQRRQRFSWSDCNTCNTWQPNITPHMRNRRAPTDLSWRGCKWPKRPEISHSV